MTSLPSWLSHHQRVLINDNNKPKASKEGQIPVFLWKCLMKSYSKNFCGLEDFGISTRQEQKPTCSVFTGFNCFGFKLSSKMFLPSECTCAQDVFCFASLRRLKKGPGLYQSDIILVQEQTRPLKQLRDHNLSLE